MKTLAKLIYCLWEFSPNDGTELSYREFHARKGYKTHIDCDEFSIYVYPDKSAIIWENNNSPEFTDNVYNWIANMLDFAIVSNPIVSLIDLKEVITQLEIISIIM